MVLLSAPLKLLIALLLGAVIGLERESKEDHRHNGHDTGTLGVRSISLITVLGAFAGLLYHNYFSLFLVICIAFASLLVTYYVVWSFITKDGGLTTEVAVFISFLLGVFVGLDVFPIQLIVAIVIVLINILSIKQSIHGLIAGIHQNELKAFLSYAIIALVILPFLPNQGYTIGDIPWLTSILTAYGIEIGTFATVELFNPFTLWRVVVIFTGIEVVGYILEKTLGQKKSWALTSIAGGFISSTSTTLSIAQRSKISKSNVNNLVAAAILSNLSSFVQLFILIASFNVIFLTYNTLLILSLIAASGILTILFSMKRNHIPEDNLKETQQQLQDDPIFSLRPALKFALILLVVRVVTKASLVIFGDSGFLVTAALASFTGIDAVVINTAEMAGTTITFTTGVWTIFLANAVNLTAKSIFSFYQGSRTFAWKFFASVIVMILLSAISLIPFLYFT